MTGVLMLVRHGQSLWNLENRFTGWMDVPLTAEGMAEARKAGQRLKGYRFDRAFTSALKRAQETLQIILQELGQTNIQIVSDWALNERHYGTLQGFNKAEAAEKIGNDLVYAWRRSFDVRPPGGESLKDTLDRVLPYYQIHVEPYVKAGETVLLVAHANTLRALVTELDHIPAKDVPDLVIPTGTPRRYLIDEKGNVIERDYL